MQTLAADRAPRGRHADSAPFAANRSCLRRTPQLETGTRLTGHEKYKEEDANWCYFFPGFDDLVATGRFEALAGDVLGPIAARLERWQPGQEVG